MCNAPLISLSLDHFKGEAIPRDQKNNLSLLV